MDDAYLAHKYAHSRAHIGDAPRAFSRRLWAVLTAPRAVVVDDDDALFHQYDAHPNPWVRRLLGSKIATVMRLAHTVVAGNAYLADYARRAGAPRVEVVVSLQKLSSLNSIAYPEAAASA